MGIVIKQSLLALILASVLGCSSPYSQSDKPLENISVRDINSYAIASCYTFLTNPYLMDQGDAFASAVLQRSQLDPVELAGLIEAVRTFSKENALPVIRSESLVDEDKTLPVLFCSEVIYDSAVKVEIGKLRTDYN